MFASQLLRILQTLPPNVNHETCAFDTAELEAIMKDNQNGALCNLNNCENDAARLSFEINVKDGFCNTPELECPMVVEDSTNGNENEVRGCVAPCTIPSNEMELFEDGGLYTDNNGNENEVGNENEFRDSVAQCAIPSIKMELFEKDTDLYTDKNVVECELPELIVCYKENTCHVVKDICIDEGVPSKDNIFTESENGKGFGTTVPSNGNQNACMTGGVKEIELLSPSGSKSSSENDYHEVDTCDCGSVGKVEIELLISDALKSSSKNDVGNDAGSMVPVQIGEANYNATGKIVNDVSGEKFVTNNMPSSPKFSKQKSLKSLLESLECDDNEVEQQSAQIPCSKANCESCAVVSAAEESNKSNPVKDLHYNSKVESATITFDFNSSKPASSGRDVSPDDVDHEQCQPLKADSEPRHEDGIPDSLAVANEVQHGQGESSFSMAGPLSGQITYSGPIAFSGSVSLRSDSSATSTRSFAFPIIQSEWNNSPVRMAKADRRHYRRHRSWRHSLLCCRF